MKKLTEESETFQILRNTGKSIQELQPIIDLPLETTQIKPKRIIKPLKKLSPRYIVAQELLEKSQIPITTIAKALNYNRCYVNELKKN